MLCNTDAYRILDIPSFSIVIFFHASLLRDSDVTLLDENKEASTALFSIIVRFVLTEMLRIKKGILYTFYPSVLFY